MKEIGNSQPLTVESSKKMKKMRLSTHYTNKKTQKTQSRKVPIEGYGMPEKLSQRIKSLRRLLWRIDCEINTYTGTTRGVGK